MYLFGDHYIFKGIQTDLEFVSKKAQDLTSSKSESIEVILDLLGQLQFIWREDGEFFKRGLDVLEKEGHFSREMNALSLKILPDLFSREELVKRLKGEFENINSLDDFQSASHFEGQIKYMPLGTVLHVTAGNVFLGAIDSLLMALITKNISIVKLSQSNLAFPRLFLESLEKVDPNKVLLSKICFLSWRGGSEEIETFFKQHVDGIVVWGGEEAVNSYRSGLKAGTKLIEHGPKVSFQVLTKGRFEQMLEADFLNLAVDVCLWDQSACANSQCLYIEAGVDEDLLLQKLSQAFESYQVSRRDLNIDENLEKYGAIELATYNMFNGEGKFVKGDDFLIELTSHNLLSSSTLNRHLLVKSFQDIDDLRVAITPFKRYLQTCGLGCLRHEQSILQNLLAELGVKRITKIGSMLKGLTGAPHDGHYDLLDLVSIVVQEVAPSPQEFALDMCTKIPYYKKFSITKFEDIPFADSSLYRDLGPSVSNVLLNPEREKGIIFSSGGTSGNPKYCFFENRELNFISKALGESYIKLGLKKSDIIANLFTAGNMWSSFSVIQKALEDITELQFPMGASIAKDEFRHLVKTFKINVVFGLPSLICDLAMNTKGLKIETVFYAGEPMRESYKKILKERWGCHTFISAGYAGVDIGPIGFQDKTCEGTEHILYDSLVYLEVVDGEAVVTSKIRSGMPVLRYKTGDRVEVIDKTNGRTKFKLEGRVDSLINIWASRISLQVILKNYSDLVVGAIQVILVSGSESDRMLFNTEQELSSVEADKFLLNIYNLSNDLKQTHSFETFKERCDFQSLDFRRSDKTGKIKDLVDNR